MKLFIFPHSGGFGHNYNFFKKYQFKNINEIYAYNYPRKLRPESKVKDERDFSDREGKLFCRISGQSAGKYDGKAAPQQKVRFL